MTDDQEAASLRVMPEVKRLLGEQGVSFAHSFASFPLCCPSRATFLTGQYAHNHGVLDNRPPRGGFARLDSSSTLPVWLEDAGYVTAHVGKYLNDYTQSDGVPPGWSEWYGLTEPSVRYFNPRLNENGEIKTYGTRPRDYSTDLFTRHAAGFIRRQSRQDQAPFFLSLAYVAPHVGRSFVSRGRCGGKGPEPAPRHDGAFDGEPIPRPPSFNESDVSDKPKAIRERPRLSPEVLRAKTYKYECRLDSLLAVDESVGRIVRALRSSGELDNTYILFTSDNGFVQGEHRIPGGKVVPYEESIRVPLLVRGPGIPHGSTARDLVSNVDLAPTVLEIADAEPGLPQDGTSMLPAAKRPALARGRAIVIESMREPGAYSGIRTARYVYSEYTDGEVEMYDLRRDRYELNSLQADPTYAGVRKELARLRDRLGDCSGEECELTPDLRLSAKRLPALRHAATCRSRGAIVRVGGPDAGAITSARFRVAGRTLRRSGERPGVIAVPPGRRARVRATLELTDGRIVSGGARVPGCRD